MDLFKEHYDRFLSDFGKGKKMVLSSAEHNKVTSRMMSIVCMNGSFYFQTDKTFRKYGQLIRNPNAALCIDNIQIEGICEEIGRPLECEAFCRLYQECYSYSYQMYSFIEDERLFVLKPTYIQRWLYQDGVPYIEVFDIENQVYRFNQYTGV